MPHARGRDEGNSRQATVNEIVRLSAEDACRCEILIGARNYGALTNLVIDGVTQAVKRLIPIRGDPEKLRRPGPYGPRFAKRASELTRVHQLTPFVYGRLILRGLLPPPELFVVQSLDAELRPERGIAGRRPGLAAISVADASKLSATTSCREIGVGWSAIDLDHVLDRDHEWAGPEHGGLEMPLTRLLDSITAAHPDTPVVIGTLDWPTRQDGVTSYVTRHPDIASQLWQHPTGLLIFGAPAPPSALHFHPVDPSEHAPGLHFSVKEHVLSKQARIVSDRTIRFRDPYGSYQYFTVAREVSNQAAVDAIAQSERHHNDLTQYVHSFATCGVLDGNIGSASAASVRAACAQITDLLMLAGSTEFDPAEGVVLELEHGPECRCPVCRHDESTRS
jgi:hypothetical protein